MESKEYYLSLSSVIEFILGGHDDIIAKRGELLAGGYWYRICRQLSDMNAGFVLDDNSLHIRDRYCLIPLYKDCIHAIERIDKQEADRKIDNDTKILNTKFAKIALYLSSIAILMSAASLIWQIISAIR